MISNKNLALASASVDALRAKGSEVFSNFVETNEQKLKECFADLLSDSTNFNAFGHERRMKMLMEYSIGKCYLQSLSEDEHIGIVLIGERQYNQNQMVMFSWIGGIALILLIAFFSLTGHKSSNNEKSQAFYSLQPVVERIA